MNRLFIRVLLLFPLMSSANQMTIEPLFHGERTELKKYLGYTSFDQFIHESDEITAHKQSLAQNLQEMNIPLNVSQSQGFILAQGKKIKSHLKKRITQNPELLSALDRMLKAESDITARGNYALYHGCKKERYALMYLHTKLDELFSGKDHRRNGFLHLRQPNGFYVPTEDPATLRKRYVSQGGQWLNLQAQYHLLFSNNTLASNLYGRDLYDECALSFFTGDTAGFDAWKSFLSTVWYPLLGKKEIDYVELLFEKYNLKSWYSDHKKIITDTLKPTLKHNVMFQLELSPYLLEHASFPCQAQGFPLNVSIHGKPTSNSVQIKAALQNAPFSVKKSHLIVWAAVLTDDLLLNPNHPETVKGFRVHVHSMEPNKLVLLEQNIDQLVERIRKDIQSIPIIPHADVAAE